MNYDFKTERWRSGRTRSGRTRSGRERTQRAAATTPELSLEERIRLYIERAPEAIEGNHGDNTTYFFASRLIWGFALNDADALRYLELYNRTKCRPPWSERDLQRFVPQAAQYRNHPPKGSFL